MDESSPTQDVIRPRAPDNGKAHTEAGESMHAQAVFDRIHQAIAQNGDDVDRLAQAFCEIGAETFGDLCSIQVLNQNNEMIHLAGMYDVEPPALSLIADAVVAMAEMPRDQGAAGQVILTGEPLFLSSVPEQALRAIGVPELVRYVDEVGMSTAMAVALKGRTGNFGVISLSRHRGRLAYTEADVESLTEIAARMSVALESALLINSLRAQLAVATARSEQSKEPLDRADGIFERLMRAFNEHGDDVDALAHAFGMIAAEAIGDLCMLTLANPHNEVLHIASLYDTDPQARSLLEKLNPTTGFMPRERSLVGPVIRNGQPILRTSISEEEARAFSTPDFVPYLEQVGIESTMSVPLRGRRGPVGAISLYRHRGGQPYEQSDLSVLISMAQQMELALENALLIESLRDELSRARLEQQSQPQTRAVESKTYMDLVDSDRLGLLHRLTHMIAKNRERTDRMMELAAVMAAESLGGNCSITLLNRYNERMYLAAYYDADPRAHSLMGELLKATADRPSDTGWTAQVLQTGQPMLLRSLDEQQLKNINIPELKRYVDEVGVSSVLVAPLKGASGDAGVISLSRHRGSPPFTETDRDFLVEIAYRLAVGVETQQTIESLRKEAAAAFSTQQALHISEQRFRSVFDSAALGIEIMDPSGLIVDINRAFETMTSFSRADMVGRPYGTLQHPEDVGRLLRMMTQLKMNREAPPPVENRILCKDGSTLWVKTYLAAVKKAGEATISSIVAMHENITGRKQAERYFEAVLQATPDALILIDSEGRIMLVNRQLQFMLGYTRDEILGQHVEALVPERLRSRHPFYRAGYLQEPHARPMGEGLQLFAVRKDGTEMPVEISLSPLEINGATVVVAAIRDISDRKKREAALIRSERSLVEAQRVARLGSIEYDLVTGDIEASDEALRILGMRHAELRDSNSVLERMHPDDRARVRAETQAVLQGRVPVEFEFRVVLPDGGERIVHDRVAPFFDPEGKRTRILGTIQDVTEQRQTEKDMIELKNHLQSSVELERLRLAQDLHDGPMQELYGASYRLDELSDGVDPELKSGLEEVNGQIQGTVDELRSIAKELRPPAISSFGLEKAIRSYMEDFQQKHPDIKLHLSLAKDHQLLPENMRMTLFRVFQQALANVLRHSQASEVWVLFSLDAEEARLVISDNGTGFVVPANWMSFVRHGHYGLAGAAERINAVGGILLVESHPQQSTTITAIIPWSRASEGPAMKTMEPSGGDIR